MAQALTLKGRVITATFIKEPLCAGDLLKERTSFNGGLGSMEPVLQMRKLGLRDIENVPKVIVSM